MPISELVDYIREQTQEGVAAEDLRVALLDAGWSEFDIENALHDVAAGMHPATPGASIHADLAQVRGMVAHLATRLKTVEAQLASIASLPAQEQLPTGFIAADHELPAPRRSRSAVRPLSLVFVIAAAAAAGIYGTDLVSRNALAPIDHIFIAAGLGLFLVLSAVIAMRRHAGWVASLCAASGVALWAGDVFIAWRIYHYMSWMVAAGLGALLVVLSLVMGRWIQRLSR